MSGASTQDFGAADAVPVWHLPLHNFFQNKSHQSLTFLFIPYEVWYTKHSGKLQFDMWMTLFDAETEKKKGGTLIWGNFLCHTTGYSNSLKAWSRGLKSKCLEGYKVSANGWTGWAKDNREWWEIWYTREWRLARTPHSNFRDPLAGQTKHLKGHRCSLQNSTHTHRNTGLGQVYAFDYSLSTSGSVQGK